MSACCKTSFQALLLLVRLRKLVTPIDDRTYSIWSSCSPTSVDPRIKYLSHRSSHLHTNDKAERVQPLDINTLHNVYVIEELTIVSNAEIIANLH